MMKEHKCFRCNGKWYTPVEKPVRCKLCGSPLWAEERKRAIGGGRKRAPGAKPATVSLAVAPARAVSERQQRKPISLKVNREGADDQVLDKSLW